MPDQESAVSHVSKRALMRRTHTKSRKGCTNCKRRKVKVRMDAKTDASYLSKDYSLLTRSAMRLES
jgi:hypothetical protein